MKVIRDTKWIEGRGELNYRKRVLMDSVPPAVNLIEDVVVPAGGRIPPHVHESTKEIFYATSGTASLVAGGEESTLGPGDLAVVDAGEEHAFTNNSSEDFKMLVLKINFREGEAILNEVKK